METLLEYGADLGAQDSHGRTPLFFAAATDRIEVADFLCDFLDVEGRELGTPDSRGDTPLHAAACNGATACVLLLLQYGTAPSERNLKGMRPIDLAARRGHTAAEKILAEYQLHHAVGNSYFDSVLFLATLEGHKKAKLALEAGAADKIVNSADITSISHGEDPSLVKQKSMWSLRRGRSMRLQQWGDWIAYEDQETHSLFW
jgi:ankyrin repeat protein